jgi:hypothetical protein
VKLETEYLERAVHFARMTAEETDAKLKASLEQQALAYRKLADKRAAELNLPTVNLPAVPAPKGDGALVAGKSAAVRALHEYRD